VSEAMADMTLDIRSGGQRSGLWLYRNAHNGE
jgi:hypothetical protein